MCNKILMWCSVALIALTSAQTVQAQKLETAVLGGGCFWCVESDFDKVPGVVETVSGYTGGTGSNPTYESYVKKGHIEVVKIVFDSEKINFQQILNIFWHSVDPTDATGQFCDRGYAYSTAIFAQSKTQIALAKASKKALEKQNPNKKIHTPILGAAAFFPSEGYHQGYAHKNPIRYKFYRNSCGRDRQVRKIWGKMAYQGIPDH